MRGRHSSIVAAVLTVLVVAVVSGCGGGGNKAANATTTEAAATTTVTEATTTEAATTTSSAPNLSKLASAANCRQFSDLASKFSQAFSGGVSSDLQEQAKFFKSFADKSPEDIRVDFEVVADAFTKIADALKGMKLQSGQTPSAEVIAKLQKLSSELDQQKLTAAEQHISAWVTKNCHG